MASPPSDKNSALAAFMPECRADAVRYVVSLLVSGLISGTLSAQPQFELTGTGARSWGMGKAFLALSTDATAVSWNPAGLVQIKRPEAAFAGLRSNLRTTTVVESLGPDTQQSRDRPYFDVDFASGSVPWTFGEWGFVVSAAYQKQSDFSRISASETSPQQADGGVYAISGAIALVRQKPGWRRLWFGATWNHQNFRYSINSAGSTSTPELDDWGDTMNLGVLANFDLIRIGGMYRTSSTSLPRTIGGGIAVLPNHKWRFAVDVEHADWSELEEKYSFPTKNTLEVRMGVERVFATPLGIMPIRAGVYRVRSPLPTMERGRLTGPRPWIRHLTLGFGRPGERVSFDVAYDLRRKSQEDDIGFGIPVTTRIRHQRLLLSLVIHRKFMTPDESIPVRRY